MTWASRAGVSNPPTISRSGAAACTTLLQLRQAYFGRVMRITRSCAGTQSSVSLTLSPMQRTTATAADILGDSEHNVLTRKMIRQRLAPRPRFERVCCCGRTALSDAGNVAVEVFKSVALADVRAS